MKIMNVTGRFAACLLLASVTSISGQRRDSDNKREGTPPERSGQTGKRSGDDNGRGREAGAQQQAQPRRSQKDERNQWAQQQRKDQQRAQQFRELPARSQAQARVWQQQRGWLKRGAWPGRGSWQQNRAQNWARDHRSWLQRGGYGGYYIPQDRFIRSFGTGNSFRLRSMPAMSGGYPRFQYGGYNFLMVDPWPEYWSNDWYGSDDVYIDYDDGYYLFNRRYPDVRLAISTMM